VEKQASTVNKTAIAAGPGLADVFYFHVSLYNVMSEGAILIDDHFNLRHNILSIRISASFGKELK